MGFLFAKEQSQTFVSSLDRETAFVHLRGVVEGGDGQKEWTDDEIQRHQKTWAKIGFEGKAVVDCPERIGPESQLESLVVEEKSVKRHPVTTQAQRRKTTK